METIRQLDGRPMVIRTVDLGADKFAGIHDIAVERNPFLGRRSIRYCLDHPEVLSEQLRAVLRASAHGVISVMFPLISSLEEVLQVRQILDGLRAEFDRDGKAYDHDMRVGIMIEVPSAAVTASLLAEHVDFFSIGTNDLIQYTLAIDRANEHVTHLYRPLHPAVLRLVKTATDAGHDKGIEVGICGEMASEIMYAILLLGLGIDHLSVAPPVIVPELKKIIRTVSMSDAERLAAEVMACPDSETALQALTAFNRELLPELFP
jgi:phosphotransferase system enzyme I (PtsI)